MITLPIMAEHPTLFEWAGGREAFDRMINAFYDRVEQDDLLSPFFPGGVHEEHRRNVATWWCEVFGGPTDYTSELGGYERMLHKHLQLGITDEAAVPVCLADEPCRRRRRHAQGPRVSFGPCRLSRMGNPPGVRATRKRTPPSIEHAPGAPLGMGRSPSVSALIARK